jgi:hypothetical protein
MKTAISLMQPPSPAQGGGGRADWSKTCADRAAARHVLPSRLVRVAPLALQEEDRGDMGSDHHNACRLARIGSATQGDDRIRRRHPC